jgi:hypothetical protein
MNEISICSSLIYFPDLTLTGPPLFSPDQSICMGFLCGRSVLGFPIAAGIVRVEQIRRSTHRYLSLEFQCRFLYAVKMDLDSFAVRTIRGSNADNHFFENCATAKPGFASGWRPTHASRRLFLCVDPRSALR